jgi:hypothetical protein
MSERLPPAMPPESRLVDRALVATVVTLILLTPPIITIFNVPVLVFGIPLLHVYCFGVWLAAIVVGGILSTLIARRGAARAEQARSGSAEREGG